MMHEPLDLLASRRYQGICYVGPARGSKTYTLIQGAMAWAATCSPADMLIVQMSQVKAREFSKKEIDRTIRHSPELASRISPRARDDNVYDKMFRSGMALNIGWPAVTQLSGATYKYVLITDYDRPENRDDVDGEGSLWDLAAKRIATFMSRGKALAESSPGGEYIDPQWRAQTLHEAPPAAGILSIYNRGTRARWYWRCKHCREYFEAQPGYGCFNLPPFEDLEEEVQKRDLMAFAEDLARIGCPHCGGIHMPGDKAALNDPRNGATWLHAGEFIDGAGRIAGERRRSEIASFWQGGVSATYQTWPSLLFRYFTAVLEYVRTGQEGGLKATTNTDSAAPYLPRAIAKRRGPEGLLERVEDWPRGTVPDGVRFLTAGIDVQSSRFVVEVHGWGVGLERWVIDRFSITSSRRPEGDRFAALDPASYAEDWDVLIQALLDKRYATPGRAGEGLAVLLALCDSGGRDGVTQRAYEFWRRLRERNLGKRLMLVKGTGKIDAPVVEMTWPDVSGRKDRASGAVGDVPVWRANVNQLKDTVTGDLGCEVSGPGYVHFPAWLEASYFDELGAESRNRRGVWEKTGGARNESFDLHVYNRAAVSAIKADRIDWNHPPAWAAPFAERLATNPTTVPAAAGGRRVRHRGIR